MPLPAALPLLLLVVAVVFEHGPPLGPLNPLMHTQSSAALLPGSDSEFAGQLMQTPASDAPSELEYFPLPQFVQATDPTVALYFPARQLAHGPPFGPDEPALHLQSLVAWLPGGE